MPVQRSNGGIGVILDVFAPIGVIVLGLSVWFAKDIMQEIRQQGHENSIALNEFYKGKGHPVVASQVDELKQHLKDLQANLAVQKLDAAFKTDHLRDFERVMRRLERLEQIHMDQRYDFERKDGK